MHRGGGGADPRERRREEERTEREKRKREGRRGEAAGGGWSAAAVTRQKKGELVNHDGTWERGEVSRYYSGLINWAKEFRCLGLKKERKNWILIIIREWPKFKFNYSWV